MAKKTFALSIVLLLAAALSACGLMRLPQTQVPTPTVSLQAAPAVTAPADASRQDALDYFREIAFTSEYGRQTDYIRKWTQSVRMDVQGSATQEDRAALQRVIDGMNEVQGFPGIALSGKDANMTIWFVKQSEMAGHFSHYVAGNWGYFEATWDSSGITRATVAIATDATSQKARNHLLFEEVLQSLGLMQDSDRYADSIFYGQWTTVQQPTKLDWELLGMLYLKDIRQGMAQADAMAVLDKEYKLPVNGNTGK